LLAQKEELRRKLKKTYVAQDIAIKAYKKALEDLRVARACKKKLQMQIDLLDYYAEDAIAVKEQEIKKLKATKMLEPVVEKPNSSSLTLGT
jgi:hypothetical protein